MDGFKEALEYAKDLSILFMPLVTWFFTRRHFQKLNIKEKETDVQSKETSVEIQRTLKMDKGLDYYDKLFENIKQEHKEQLERRDKDYQEQKARRDREIKKLSEKFDEYKKSTDAERKLDKAERQRLHLKVKELTQTIQQLQK